MQDKLHTCRRPQASERFEGTLASASITRMSRPFKENSATDTGVELQDREKVCVVCSLATCCLGTMSGTSTIPGHQCADKPPLGVTQCGSLHAPFLGVRTDLLWCRHGVALAGPLCGDCPCFSTRQAACVLLVFGNGRSCEGQS